MNHVPPFQPSVHRLAFLNFHAFVAHLGTGCKDLPITSINGRIWWSRLEKSNAPLLFGKYTLVPKSHTDFANTWHMTPNWSAVKDSQGWQLEWATESKISTSKKARSQWSPQKLSAALSSLAPSSSNCRCTRENFTCQRLKDWFHTNIMTYLWKFIGCKVSDLIMLRNCKSTLQS